MSVETAKKHIQEMKETGGIIKLDNDCYYFYPTGTNFDDDESIDANVKYGCNSPVPKNLLIAALEELGLTVELV